MANNEGAAPPDFSTNVGKMRAALGDTTYTEIPPTPPSTTPTGLGEYTCFSDVELQAFFEMGGDTLEGGLALAYNSMATAAAVAAKSISDFDLKLSTEKRAEYLLRLAREWQDKADTIADDFFEVFGVGAPCCPIRPEGAPPVVCNVGCRAC